MTGCIFCKIVNKEIKSEIVYEDEFYVVFKDINPQAPIHLLIVPKQHIESINEAEKLRPEVLARVFDVINTVADKLGVKDVGYRIVVNTGKDAGQEIKHLHFHFLAGRKFSWPPG